MPDLTDFRVFRSTQNENPVFRVFDNEEIGRPDPDDMFALHFPRGWDDAHLELSWAADGIGIDGIKNLFFPTSTLTLDEDYSNQFEWYFVTLSAADRAWFELAAE